MIQIKKKNVKTQRSFLKIISVKINFAAQQESFS